MTKLTKTILVICIVSICSAAHPDSTHSQLSLDVSMDRTIFPADVKETAYIWVQLTGFDFDREKYRPPVNVALVIDKSGSMEGEKIEQAKQAAIMAVQKLNSNDIVSVITYDTKVQIVVHATKASNKSDITNKIRKIFAGGSTALYAGVSTGAQEIRKFIELDRVNRLILLSDGLANVGPQTPNELGQLGVELIQDGISVSTIGLGLGFNEDLMTQLAYKSDGAHYFAENAVDLHRIFDQELGKTLSVVAQDVEIIIKCHPGIRPVRLLGRHGKIDGQQVHININQIYSKHQKYALLEVELAPTHKDLQKNIAVVSVDYRNLKSNVDDELKASLEAKFTDSKEKSEKTVNRDVMVCVVEQIANEQNEKAVLLRDAGKNDMAQQMLMMNAAYLRSNSARYQSEKLKEYEILNSRDAKNLDESKWQHTRKSMRGYQSRSRQQE